MMNKRLLRHGRQTQIRCAGTHRARCGDGDGHAECVQQRIANGLNNLGTFYLSNYMSRIILLALVFVCSGCIYPRYVGQKPKTYINTNFLSFQDTIHVNDFYFSATRRKNTGLNQPYEKVELAEDIEKVLTNSMKHPNIFIRNLKIKSQIEGLEGKKIKRKHLENALSQEFTEGFVLLPIVNYYVRYEPRREAGGPVGFSSPTGEDSHIISHEVVIALYKNSELVFLNSKASIDREVVLSDTPITHEFPQEVLDTLMHMALEPLLRQMEEKR
jgi:hypothetical protein